MDLSPFRASLDVLCLVDAEDVIVDSNRPLGIARERPRIVELVALDSRPALQEALAAVRATGTPARLDVAVPRDDDTLAHYQLSIARVEASPLLAIVAADITARKAVEDRLLRAEALMVDTQGTAHLGTWEWDPKEPHATWSAELYKIYGLTPETYTPSYQAYLEKVHPDDRPHVIAATEGVFTKHEPYSHDERILRPDGTMRYLHTWAHAIVSPQGALLRLIGVCQDITDRKLAEIALEQRAIELARANERLREEAEERARVERLLGRAQKLEAIGRFSAGIAHDVNNMLGVIVGYASLLSRKVSDPKLRDHVTEIMSVVERAGRLTGQLLTFSSEQAIEQGTVDLDRAIVDIERLLRRMLGDRVELVLDLHANATGATSPLVVTSSASQVEQVLMNLAVNARDAMPHGGKFTITTRAVDDTATLVVTDTGTGMTEEVQAKIFDPFFTTKAAGRGTGLGLSTVYGIVKQCGGTIAVASSPGQGTRFDIRIPRAEVAFEAPQPPLESTSAGETILLVEDEADLRSVVASTLEAYGYHVIEAADGVEALEQAAATSQIDLLLTDVVMPRISGPELAERLRDMRPELRVLFMSGYTAETLGPRMPSPRVGALRKPFSPGDLARKVRELFDAP